MDASIISEENFKFMTMHLREKIQKKFPELDTILFELIGMIKLPIPNSNIPQLFQPIRNPFFCINFCRMRF
jgi:hypothetical protein